MSMRRRKRAIPPKAWAGVALVAVALALLPFVAALAGQAHRIIRAARLRLARSADDEIELTHK